MKNTYLAPFTFIISSPIKNRPSLLINFFLAIATISVSVPMQLISYCVICTRIRALLRGKLTPDLGTFAKCTYLEKPCMVYHSMYSMPDQTNIVHIFKCASPSPLVNTIPRQGQIYSKWVLVLTNLLHHLTGLSV